MNIREILSKGYLISPGLMNRVEVIERIFDKLPKNITVINEEVVNGVLSSEQDSKTIEDFPVEIVKSYAGNMKKRVVEDFVTYFRNRYNSLGEILRGRGELQNSISIRRFLGKQNTEVSFTGIVVEKRLSKNGNLLIQMEDLTGNVTVIIGKDKEVFKKGNDIVVDEVLGVTGNCNGNFVFCRDIFFPDAPISNEFKKCGEEVYAAFISDLHVGSKMFLPQPFKIFIKWINCNLGERENIELASKIKYLFVAGDLVDGVGIYPEQDRELEIMDVGKQYEECARYLGEIRKDIKIIVCGGNHDALRLSEPQPILDKNYAKSLYEIKNIQMVTNPSYVNIHKKNKFPGFNVLMYHGYSYDYYISNVESIRMNGGYDRADLVMKFLLQKRHLAPSHSSTLYIPDIKEDSLIIKDIPDFFVSGHLHKMSVGNYRNVTTLCSSCWQGKTIFQERVGHHPEPGRVPLINLGTREIKVMKFCD